MFKEADDETRSEILTEIATAKQQIEDNTIGTFVKGVNVDYDKYDGVKPVIENGRTLAPLRAVVETLGADVTWDEETQSLTIAKDDTVITMTIGDTTAYVNGEAVTLETAPKIHGNRTLVPIRFIAEQFGLTVNWDDDSQTIVIE